MAISDSDFLASIANPVWGTFRKRGFFWSDLRLSVPNSDVYYYSFVSSSDKHTVIYGRNLAAGEGPVAMDLLFGATYTAGTPDPPINLFAGGPPCDAVFTNGCTDVSGGVVSNVDYLFSAGNNSAVAGSGGQPTIFPPDTELLIRLTNTSAGNNPGIQLQLAFVEINIPDL